MLMLYLLHAAVLLLFGIQPAAANPGDVLACVPCPGNDCTGKTFGDGCKSGHCGFGSCLPSVKRGEELHGTFADAAALRNVTSGGEGGGGLGKRGMGRISHGCVLWVEGQSEAGIECDVCTATAPFKTWSCKNQ